MRKPIRLLVADDQPLILDGITAVLKRDPRLDIVKTCLNGEEVIDYFKGKKNLPVDIAILDINMPKKNGLDCMEYLSERFPELKVIFLTIYQEEFVIRRMMELGAKAFLLKNTHSRNLLHTIQVVDIGFTYFDEVEEIIQQKKYDHATFKISNREREIISLIVRGLSSPEISEKLSLSEHTIKTHRRNIMKKLNFNNSAQLVSFAKSSGIIPE